MTRTCQTCGAYREHVTPGPGGSYMRIWSICNRITELLGLAATGYDQGKCWHPIWTILVIDERDA